MLGSEPPDREGLMQATEDSWTAQVFTWDCPFLSCIEDRPHRHSVCPSCGAVGFGNLSCHQCRLAHALKLDTVKIGDIEQPVIGQRVIEHDIRLREGEANVLGGIFQTQTSKGVPEQCLVVTFFVKKTTNGPFQACPWEQNDLLAQES